MNKRLSKGFSLIEVAAAIAIVGLLGIGVSIMLGKEVIKSKEQTTALRLEKIRIQLLNFVQTNGYLPCPDSASPIDGLEDRQGNDACHRQQGRLPWKTIGAPAEDAWGNYFYYRINSRADNGSYIHDVCQSAAIFGRSGSVQAPTGFVLCKSTRVFYCNKTALTGQNSLKSTDETKFDNYKICQDADIQDMTGAQYAQIMQDASIPVGPPFIGTFTPPVGGDNEGSYLLKVYDESGTGSNDNRLAGAVEAVVVSFGKNGKYTWDNTTNGGTALSSPTIGSNANNSCGGLNLSALEIENCDGDEDFMLDTSGQEDDQMIWIDIFDVKQALMRGGKL